MRPARLCPGLTLRWSALGGPESILLAMKTSRHHIAAGVTVVALGALATVALASGESTSNDTSAARSTPAVRTETVHRQAERSASPDSSRSRSRSAASTATPTSTVHHRRGRGTDDAAIDDHRGRGSDDVGVDDHGDRGRGGDDSGSDDHGGGHGRGGHDD
jgi:hypothetical protein